MVGLVGQRRGAGEERRPGRERRRADRVVDERADPGLDVLPFEREDHEVVAEVNRMPRDAEIRRVERRPRSDELGRPVLHAALQLQGDDQPLHGPIIRFFLDRAADPTTQQDRGYGGNKRVGSSC